MIHYYLKEIVFPRTMRIQRVKISASGQELGSEMLFGRRHVNKYFSLYSVYVQCKSFAKLTFYYYS